MYSLGHLLSITSLPRDSRDTQNRKKKIFILKAEENVLEKKEIKKKLGAQTTRNI